MLALFDVAMLNFDIFEVCQPLAVTDRVLFSTETALYIISSGQEIIEIQEDGQFNVLENELTFLWPYAATVYND
jgi:hypothetical protein